MTYSNDFLKILSIKHQDKSIDEPFVVFSDRKLGDLLDSIKVLFSISDTSVYYFYLQRLDSKLDNNNTFKEARVQDGDHLILIQPEPAKIPILPLEREIQRESSNPLNRKRTAQTPIISKEVQNQKEKKKFPSILVGTVVISTMSIASIYFLVINQSDRSAVDQLNKIKVLKLSSKFDECVKESQAYLDKSKQKDEIQNLLIECRNKLDEDKLLLARQLFKDKKYDDAFNLLKQLDPNSPSYDEAKKLRNEWLDVNTNQQMLEAKQLTKNKEYAKALAIFSKIPPDSTFYKDAQDLAANISNILFEQAKIKYEEFDDLKSAYDVIQLIPAEVPFRKNADAEFLKWQNDHKINSEIIQKATEAFNKGDLSQVETILSQTLNSSTPFWKKQAQDLINKVIISRNPSKLPSRDPPPTPNQPELPLPPQSDPNELPLTVNTSPQQPEPPPIEDRPDPGKPACSDGKCN
jgi:tetratricopeptide (TPR) repeat protein